MESMTFVLFGATGDLAKRKIFPALYNLYLEGKLPSTFSVIGLGRRELSHETFQSNVERSIMEFSRRQATPSPELTSFLSAFRYHPLDVTRPEDYRTLLQLVQERESELGIPDNRMFYLSVAPDLFDLIASNIKASGLGSTRGWKRLVIEKPFGHDLASARELNEKLSKSFEEDEVYRIDHYLGKTMVQNLETFVLANPVIQAVWNKEHIANIQITASETVGVEERAGYYDQSGAIRDMIQNHMLQMLMMTAMHQPTQISAATIRAQKKQIMENLRPVPRAEVAKNVVRGQYAAGSIQGKAVPAYLDEPGIEAASRNDTFVAARLWIDDEKWKGVPFYIRTGKRLAAKSTRIVVEFKNPTEHLYAHRNEQTSPNLLVIEINPNEKISFLLNGKNVLNEGVLDEVRMDSQGDKKQLPEAYERLIYDALQGDSTFFAHWNEVELSWQWVQPILDAFAANEVPLHTYEAGSNGPEASERLLKEEGFEWLLDPVPSKSLQMA
ncbi:glucose-6-phosphate dehydrogenase [Cohnella lubricantis]|uniref:Glucose-6-phosphate 1-dehydrogenase n=1 Tax=Cohnella lubricantis TaxID=2163172 RepID=A0A841TEC5_9BACL|nr:glucose-6-phosphate dehydrogenase [Cohnella lubricantis]MBB6678606.1 glucose-6-phosphate dehydrogenase [Cohnella lubricantis]MBP2119235.1 glucose-6-phosphate 1-dehydrogenase [Cohnella lubricantis]